MGTTTRAIALWGGIVFVVLIIVLSIAWGGPRGPRPNSPASTETEQASTHAPSTAGTAAPPQSAVASSSAGQTGAASAVAVLVGAGDIAECSEGADAETADLVESVDGIVFTLGDNAYEDGTFAEFEDCYGPTWGRPSIKDRTMPVAGNHDYHTSGAEGYFRYFGEAAGDPGKGWYAYDAGAWRIYALNSNCDAIGGCESGSAQERWLREDLAANPRACVAAMWHHPRFSSGVHGNHDVMADLWRTLQDAGAELVLAGHDHSYERFAPQDASGRADDRGLVEMVVGTGGRNPYAFRAPRPNSLVRESPVFGVMRLVLGTDEYAFEFLAVAGDDFTDRGTSTCH